MEISLEFEDRGDVLTVKAESVEELLNVSTSLFDWPYFERFLGNARPGEELTDKAQREAVQPKAAPAVIKPDGEIVRVSPDTVKALAREGSSRSKDLADDDRPAGSGLLLMAKNKGVELEEGREYSTGEIRELLVQAQKKGVR